MNCPFCVIYSLFLVAIDTIKLMEARIEAIPYGQVIIFTLLWTNVMAGISLVSMGRRRIL